MSALSSLVLATLPFAGVAAPASSSLALAMAPQPAPVTAAQPAEEEEDEAQETDRHTQGLVLRGYGRTGTVGLPGVGVGGGLSVGYQRKRFRLDLMGAGQLNRAQWYPGGQPGGARVGGDFALWRVGLRACAVFGSGKVSTPICGGADTGMITATGVGIDTPRTERRPWSSVFADIDMVWHVKPRLGLVVTSRGLVPLVRQSFYVGDRGTLVTTSPFGIEVGLGLEIILL